MLDEDVGLGDSRQVHIVVEEEAERVELWICSWSEERWRSGVSTQVPDVVAISRERLIRERVGRRVAAVVSTAAAAGAALLCVSVTVSVDSVERFR